MTLRGRKRKASQEHENRTDHASPQADSRPQKRRARSPTQNQQSAPTPLPIRPSPAPSAQPRVDSPAQQVEQQDPAVPPALRLNQVCMKRLSKSYAGVDLNSKSQTRAAEFHFPIDGFDGPPATELGRLRKAAGSQMNSSGTYQTPFPGPITLLHTLSVSTFCLVMKSFLFEMFGNTWFGADGILRIESLELHKLGGVREGFVLLAEDACRVAIPRKGHEYEKEGYGATLRKSKELVEQIDPEKRTLHEKQWLNATLFAILTPKKGVEVNAALGNRFTWEQDIRWFWSVLPITPILKALGDRNVSVVRDHQPGTPKHKLLSTLLRSLFEKAVNIPHSTDFTNSELETNVCPSIIDPDNAIKRLEGNKFLQTATIDSENYGRDLSDDRYLHRLHPAEREATSLADMNVAQYLLMKRGFFKSFYEEIYRSDKDIDPQNSNLQSSRGRGVQSQATQPPPPEKQDAADSGREDTPMSTATSAAATPVKPTPSRQRTPGSVNRAAGPVTGAVGSRKRKVRVRTDTAHQKWLELQYEVRPRRAKCLVECWKELGFLDERRYLGMVRAGGVFEGCDVEGESDGEQE